MVGLGSDPINGGYTAKLLQITVAGKMMPAASSAVVLAPDAMGKVYELTRDKSQPKDAVSGNRVFLPTHTIVRFTLSAVVQPKSIAMPSSRPVPAPAPAPIAAPTSPPLPFVKWNEPLAAMHTKDLKAVCESKDNREQAICFSVFSTLQDSQDMAHDSQSSLFGACMPDKTTAEAVKEAFLSETETLPDQLDGPVAIFYSRMLDDKFPCPKVAPKPKRTVPKTKAH